MNTTTAIPQGYHTVTPYLTAEKADRLIDFFRRVFDAQPVERHERPDGTLMHATIRLGDSMLMLSEGCGDWGAQPTQLYLYVPDVDAAYDRAVAAGSKPLMPVAAQFWGDRMGGVKDPWGNLLWIATHIEEVSPKEMERRARAFAVQTANHR